MIPVLFICLTVAFPSYIISRADQSRPLRRPWLFAVGSFVCCAAAVLQEILEIRSRLLSDDTAGIWDTIDASIVLCVLLIAVAVTGNLLALWRSYEMEAAESARQD